MASGRRWPTIDFDPGLPWRKFRQPGDPYTGKWLAQVFGDPETDSFEISVVREDNEQGRNSWGWFNDAKMLVCHNHLKVAPRLAPGLGPLMGSDCRKARQKPKRWQR